MTGLTVDLPRGRGGGTFDWLLAGLRSGDRAYGSDAVTLVPRDGGRLDIVLGGRTLLSYPAAPPGNPGSVEIAPGLAIPPADPETLTQFLRDNWLALDHVGFNLSHRDLDIGEWTRAIAEIGAALPAYRLEIDSANDIVMIVVERDGRASTAELVYDRAASVSSMHFCARVAVPRLAVEAAFPTPVGAYKPGDEAFFRSVALDAPLGMPVYVDLAFSDAQMAPWPQIVAAMGKRLA
ncbi:MAG TPA: hypothetical protein VL899_08260 [Alphaproteobacteria bacterium]|nr:hypothetical protein [Alphaproteobacteria bacterium]